MKKYAVISNLFATFIFCIGLTYWLYLKEYREEEAQANAASKLTNNDSGVNKTQKGEEVVIHFDLALFIFYGVFLTERTGSYILDVWHHQFEFEMMRWTRPELKNYNFLFKKEKV